MLPAGVTDATVDLCSDPACATVISSADVTGTSYTPALALPAGVAFWRVYLSTDASVTSPIWEFWVGKGNAPVDTSWGTTLDVNNDGLSDLAVGAVGYGSGTSVDQGAVWVIVGDGTDPSTQLTGGNQFTFFGLAVSSAGDMNGDGYGDLAVTLSGPAVPGGATYVYAGGSSFPPFHATVLPGASHVASGGDVNGDGYADLLLAGTEGGASLSLGSGGGPTTPVTLLAVGTEEGPLGAMGSGDVDGDGFADVFLGPADPGDTIYICPGSDTGPGEPVAFVALANTTGATMTDVNGDGYADLVVGQTTALSVYFGSPGGLVLASPATLSLPAGVTAFVAGWARVASAGDVNLDGYGDVIVVGTAGGDDSAFVYLGGPDGLAATPVSTLAASNGSAVGSVGDFNGDGYPDVALGSGVTVYPGGPDGVGTTSFFTFSAAPWGPSSFFGATY